MKKLLISGMTLYLFLISLLTFVYAETILLFDDFNNENNGVYDENYCTKDNCKLENWIALFGSVDLCGNGTYDFYPGNGLYLDLDGTTGEAAILKSNKEFNLTNGLYELSFDIGGSTRGDTNSLTVTLGDIFIKRFTLTQDDPMKKYTYEIDLRNQTNVNNVYLTFEHSNEGDLYGILLDNVKLIQVYDSTNCEIIDTDNDGVIDELDECQNTTSGSFVDNVGCSATDLYIEEQNLVVSAKANIYGAGKNTPPGDGILPTSVTFDSKPNQVLTFSKVEGQVHFGPGVLSGPDGEIRAGIPMSSYGGLSGLIVEYKCKFLVGVFLDDTEPSPPAPESLEYTSDNFESFSPKLNQVFLIGDGLTGISTGKVQNFHVPTNATRLFLGFVDGVNSTPGAFYNNEGEFEVSLKISSLANVSDEDNDGVPDYLDNCPGTNSSQYTDSKGCSPGGIFITNEQAQHILENMNNIKGILDKIGIEDAINALKISAGMD